jgi:hypothetical protein
VILDTNAISAMAEGDIELEKVLPDGIHMLDLVTQIVRLGIRAGQAKVLIVI